LQALVSVSGYLIGSQESGKMPLPPKAEPAVLVIVVVLIAVQFGPAVLGANQRS
jgi:hypothetical protein